MVNELLNLLWWDKWWDKNVRQKSSQITQWLNGQIGGAEGDRTPDLSHAMRTLSQLSYGPIDFEETRNRDLCGKASPLTEATHPWQAV